MPVSTSSSVDLLAQTAAQVGRTGTPEQVETAVEVLDESRRRLYSILA
nr:hypothetical protein [Agromyces kandeliae]